MQAQLYADVMNPATEPSERARVAQAWERLEERKRVLLGRPMPRSVDVSKLPKRGSRGRSQAAGPVEPGAKVEPAKAEGDPLAGS